MPSTTRQTSNRVAPGVGLTLRIGGIPLFVHWTVLPIDFFIAVNAYIASTLVASGADWRVLLGACFSYTLSIVAHEFGHAIAARCTGLKVHSIYVSGSTSRCFTDPPRTTRGALLLYSGGLLAHLVLLGIAASYLALFGWPQSLPALCAVGTFIAVNVISIVLVSIPYRWGAYVSDGLHLWRLLVGKA